MLTLQQCCNNYTFFIFMSCKTCHSTATRLIPRTKCNLWNIWRHLLGLLFSPWVTRTVVSATIWSLVVSHVRLYSFGLLRCFFPFFFIHVQLKRSYIMWLFQIFPVDQRNGDGEAKCPAGRAGVCPTVLHALEPGPGLPAQVQTTILYSYTVNSTIYK